MARRALIVAIDAYPYPNTLPSCINDAKAVAALLAGMGYTGKQILDAAATRANVLAGLDWLLAGAQPDDDLVFYYSGHGYNPTIDGSMQQCLVLIDGMLLDNDFTPRTALVPPGTLTVLLDACFSGGFDKFMIIERLGKSAIEQPKVKSFVPLAGDHARLGIPAPVEPAEKIADLQFFGSGEAQASAVAAKSICSCAQVVSKGGTIELPKSGPIAMNGLLIAACLETETATASTSATAGKSAFTFALLSAIDRIGTNRSNRELFQTAAAHLQRLGFRQTPVLREPAQPGDLSDRRFLTLDPLAAAPPTAAPPVAPAAAAPGVPDVAALAALLGALIPALVAVSKAPAPPPVSHKSPEQLTADLVVAVIQQLLSQR